MALLSVRRVVGVDAADFMGSTFSTEPRPARNIFRETVDETEEKTVVATDEWPRVRTVILRTLRKFPEAFDALRVAMAAEFGYAP